MIKNSAQQKLRFLLQQIISLMPSQDLTELPFGDLSTGVLVVRLFKGELDWLEVLSKGSDYRKPNNPASDLSGWIAGSRGIKVYDDLITVKLYRAETRVIGGRYIRLNDFLYEMVDSLCLPIQETF